MKAIFRFWFPLAATWLMMAAEGPFVAALVARLADPTFNLAAFGVAMTLGFFAEAPIIMMLSASTALVRDADSLRELRRFSIMLNGGVTLVMAVIATPTVFDVIAGDVLALPDPVARLARMAVVALLPWPAAIGFRRFHQGILIASGRPRLVAYGTVARLGTMALTGVALYATTGLDGAVVGTLALSAGVTAESTATWLWARPELCRLRSTAPSPGGALITARDIQRFYWPLALTPLINMVAQPMVTFFVGRGRLPIESLAVIPVVNSFGFVFRSTTMAFQEVVIALGREGEAALRSLARFAWALGLGASLVMAVVVLTPLSNIWFGSVAGLSPDLVALARRAAVVMVPTPAVATLVVWAHARLVMAKSTRLITASTVLEVAVIVTTMLVGVRWVDVPGVYIAVTAILAGRVVAASFLRMTSQRAVAASLLRSSR